MNKTLTKIILAVVIFCVSAGAYYYPTHKKGYPLGADYLNLIEARNFAASGTYMSQDKIGTYLSSANAKNGDVTGIPNPLTPIIYGYIFKYFGFHLNLPFYLAIVLFSVFNLIVFLLLSRLFSVGVGFIGGILGAFIPTVAVGASIGGFYEWAMLFFAVALWFYLGSKNGPLKAGLVRVLLASVFFAMAALARNAFAASFIPFFFYDLYIHRSVKRSLIFILPFLVIFGLTLTPYSWLGVPNGYLSSTQQPFSEMVHLFDDPYAYFFNRDQYIAQYFGGKTINRVTIGFLEHYGYSVSIKNIIKAYYQASVFYVNQFFNIINFGGPAIIFLMILGIWQFYKRNTQLFHLFILWLFLWLSYLVYAKSGNWDHYLEIIFVIITLSSLGVYCLYNWARSNLPGFKYYVAAIFITGLLLIQLSQSAKWRFHDDYRSSTIGIARALAAQVNKNLDGSYAVDIHPNVPYALNYFTDHNVIFFNADTVRELLASKKLKSIFGIYDVKGALGYPPDLSAEIAKTLKIQVIPCVKNDGWSIEQTIRE